MENAWSSQEEQGGYYGLSQMTNKSMVGDEVDKVALEARSGGPCRPW